MLFFFFPGQLRGPGQLQGQLPFFVPVLFALVSITSHRDPGDYSPRYPLSQNVSSLLVCVSQPVSQPRLVPGVADIAPGVVQLPTYSVLCLGRGITHPVPVASPNTSAALGSPLRYIYI